MVDALVGAVIMAVASTSLLLAVEVVENAFRSAGNTPLNPDEKLLLDRWEAEALSQNGSKNDSALELIDDVKVLLTEKLPKQYQ